MRPETEYSDMSPFEPRNSASNQRIRKCYCELTVTSFPVDHGLLLRDALSLLVVQAFERAAGGMRMGKIFPDIQNYHAPATVLQAA